MAPVSQLTRAGLGKDVGGVGSLGKYSDLGKSDQKPSVLLKIIVEYDN